MEPATAAILLVFVGLLNVALSIWVERKQRREKWS